MEEVEIGNFGIGRKRWIARQTMPWLGRGGDAEMIICAAAAPFAIPAIAIEYKESNSSAAKAARYLLRNTTPCVNAGSIQRQPLPWMRDHPTKRPASRHNSSVRQVAYPTIKLFGKTLILVEGLMGPMLVLVEGLVRPGTMTLLLLGCTLVAALCVLAGVTVALFLGAGPNLLPHMERQ